MALLTALVEARDRGTPTRGRPAKMLEPQVFDMAEEHEAERSLSLHWTRTKGWLPWQRPSETPVAFRAQAGHV